MTQVASRGAARRKRHDRIRLRLAGTAGGRAWPCSAASTTSTPRSSTTRPARRSPPPRPSRRSFAAPSRPSPRRRPSVGQLVAERAKAAGVDASSSIEPGSGTTGGSSRSPTPPAKPASTSDRKEHTWHGSTRTSSRSRSASSRSTASPRSSRAAGGSASARSSSSVTARATSGSGSARPARCPRRSARASRTRRRTSSRSRWSARRSPTRSTSSSRASRSCSSPPRQGTGVIAGGSVRAVVEAAGIRDILSKVYGSTNPVNVTRATHRGAPLPALGRGASARRGVKPVSRIAGQPAPSMEAADGR